MFYMAYRSWTYPVEARERTFCGTHRLAALAVRVMPGTSTCTTDVRMDPRPEIEVGSPGFQLIAGRMKPRAKHLAAKVFRDKGCANELKSLACYRYPPL